jgi:hypothetical protein
MDTTYTYEIEFDVRGSYREEYRQWLSENGTRWVSHPSVRSFERRENANGLSPAVKLLFGFGSVEGWRSFVESDVHTEAKATLRRVATDLDATLWERSGLVLDASDRSERKGSPPFFDPPSAEKRS